MNFRQIKAIETQNKKRILAVNPNVPTTSGIYILTRYEKPFKYAYVGQAKNLLSRLAQHLSGYQHIDISIKKHKFFSKEHPTGWDINFIECLDYEEKEKEYIERYANMGYQMRNKTAGGQGQGKVKINEYKPNKTYTQGKVYGRQHLAEELKHIMDKYLNIELKKDNVSSQKALEKFYKLLGVENE